MTEKKKEKTISEKPRYGMWNNAWFMIGKAWKYEKSVLAVLVMSIILEVIKYSLQGTTQGRYLTGGVPPCLLYTSIFMVIWIWKNG